MKKILSFRPGVADDATAFEAMAQIYKYLEREYDYEFTILTWPSDDYQDEQLNITTIPKSETKLNRWNKIQFLPSANPGWVLSSKVKSYFDEADGVLTLDPTTHPQGGLAIQYAIKSDTPIWFDAGRTTARPWLGLKWKLRRRQIQKYLANVAGIIVTSPKAIERFREIGLYDQQIASKFTVMGHPVDVNTFHPPENDDSEKGDIQIATLGRLVPEKGVYYILEALTPVLKKRDNVHWVIIGPGPMRDIIEQEIKDRGLRTSVDVKGKVPHEDVPKLLRRADLHISHPVDIARWEEFFGVANLEAMASGVASIVTDSGSIPYVIREEDIARITPQRDVTALRRETKKLIESPEQRERLSRRSREFVKREYSVDSVGKKYHRMLA